MKAVLKLIFLISYYKAFAFEELQKTSFAHILETSGDVYCLSEDSYWKKIEKGKQFDSHFILKTGKGGFVKILFDDNSLLRVSETTGFEVYKGKQTKIKLTKGKIRLFSYKNEKLIQTPSGTSIFKEGEFQWDVYKMENKLKLTIKGYSGRLKIKGEVYEPLVYSVPPEKKPENIQLFDKPHLYWFYQLKDDVSYDIPFNPKTKSRKIASVEQEDINTVEYEEIEEIESFKKVKEDIWVHDIVFDETVRILEKASLEKAKELIPPLVETASNELVWEVASRSVLKWGVLYAKEASYGQVSNSVSDSYFGETEDDFNFYQKKIFRKETEDITQSRSLLAARSAVLIKGREKGWKEAKKYAEKMMPLILKPIVMIKVQEYALPIAKEAVYKIIELSNLNKTKEVDNLLVHLSQLIAERATLEVISEISSLYVEKAAKLAAREAANVVANDIATFMAEKSAKKAGDIIIKILSREKSRKVASEIASDSKEQEAQQIKTTIQNNSNGIKY